MSEDKTEILGNTETTEELEAPKAPTTNPMLEAILAKVNAIGEDLGSFRQEVNARFDNLETSVRELREETAKNFRIVDRKFDVLNNQMLKVQAEVVDHHIRLEDIERKAS